MKQFPGLDPQVRKALVEALPIQAPSLFKLLANFRNAKQAYDPKTSSLESSRLALCRDLELVREKADAVVAQALKRLAPEVALDQDLFKRGVANATAIELLRVAGMNRFVWCLGVAGSGREETAELITDYLDASARWVASQYCLNLLQPAELGVPVGISSTGSMEETRRVFSTDIRFAWVSEMILTKAVNKIASDPLPYERLKVTAETIKELFAWLRGLHDEWTAVSQTNESLSVDLHNLLSNMSVETGALQGRNLSQLIFSNDIERYPFVRFGDQVMPLAPKEAIFYTEYAFFELVRREVSSEKERSDLYEAVISDCLREVAPPGVSVPLGPLEIPTAGQADPGEVDFALCCSACLLIGEAKACFVSIDSSSVINAFGDQMGKAAKQLRLRLDRLGGGRPLLSGRDENSLTDGMAAFGLAVPLHSYAGAIWRNDALQAIGVTSADIAFIPLHPLLIIMQTLLNGRDLSLYLIIRGQYLAANVVILDELDFLYAFLQGPPQEHERYLSKVPATDVLAILQPRTIATEVGLFGVRPVNRRGWRKEILRDFK